MNGFPLFDLAGQPLVRRVKKCWVDQRKEPAIVIEKSLYDRDAIAKLTNSKGTPVWKSTLTLFSVIDT